ncbi:hypothetical protein [Chitinophaga sp. sic0106]|uniref:hypothetical protein n=1 Tax=Chitinophaga sp. sic0106 TaxID=2854785 RepID=UPI001C4571B0|nr:hypothetical protein [Chitinophaga sp. sic0106]MBV7529901.1 hypothetical protein [Chitinophaga sp. sic0106]
MGSSEPAYSATLYMSLVLALNTMMLVLLLFAYITKQMLVAAIVSGIYTFLVYRWNKRFIFKEVEYNKALAYYQEETVICRVVGNTIAVVLLASSLVSPILQLILFLRLYQQIKN